MMNSLVLKKKTHTGCGQIVGTISPALGRIGPGIGWDDDPVVARQTEDVRATLM